MNRCNTAQVTYRKIAMPEKDNNSIVAFTDNYGRLIVKLERPVFESVIKHVQDESSLQELTEIDSREVRELVVIDASQFSQSNRYSSGWKDRLALLGCGVIGFAVLFVFVIGIFAISGFVPLPRW
jgi:hypothetical protein